MLIVFEGLDGSGKSSQIELLKKEFDCIVFKFPTKNFSILNDYLEKKVELDSKSLFLLFLADIANELQNLSKVISKNKNKIIILDRYVFSTIAYEINGIDYERAKTIIDKIGFIRPDKVILLDLPSSISYERKKKQKELDRYEENVQYLEKVRLNFLKLEKDRFLTSNWHKIDATKSISDIHQKIMELL